ncbi:MULTISPECIES: hypothetical protein [unclassified Meiothermus]|uniref:hypothetical protein n=1 Tax=unclassified Meiothermus TaxID=370471 RepID=UPI000D7C5BC9|nr:MULTISPECIES: hypothetical protein [unclassified Meiothermus]PZA08216.1 hypothetical protein DNA98_03495 [Meiothermus sp. Pnk-1]RYM38958.1 hypothetical protein EWH23_04305 [Meiothermus sp. PNK-Is4]
MESLGPYLLRRPLGLAGDITTKNGQPLTVFEAQDARTGIPVLVYRPVQAALPEKRVEGSLPWLEALTPEDGSGAAWIAELPLGAVPASRYLGSAPAERLRDWVIALAETLERAEAAHLEHGAITPERIWVKGSKAWLEGLGLPIQPLRPDREGLLESVRALAGEDWSGLPWKGAFEAWVTGNLAAEQLREQLQAAAQTVPSSRSAPKRRGSSRIEPEEFSFPVSPRPEPSPVEPAPTLEQKGEETLESATTGIEPSDPSPPKSKASLKVEIAEQTSASEPLDTHQASPPKKVRIDDPLEPPFPVIDPGYRRRAIPGWLRGVLLLLVLVGIGFLAYQYWPRPSPATHPGFTVTFRVEPAGQNARIELLEAPEGSTMLVGTVIAEVPGPVFFDKAGVYRLRIRANGREPSELLLEVPAPNGVNIRLR